MFIKIKWDRSTFIIWKLLVVRCLCIIFNNNRVKWKIFLWKYWQILKLRKIDESTSNCNDEIFQMHLSELEWYVPISRNLNKICIIYHLKTFFKFYQPLNLIGLVMQKYILTFKITKIIPYYMVEKQQQQKQQQQKQKHQKENSA